MIVSNWFICILFFFIAFLVVMMVWSDTKLNKLKLIRFLVFEYLIHSFQKRILMMRKLFLIPLLLILYSCSDADAPEVYIEWAQSEGGTRQSSNCAWGFLTKEISEEDLIRYFEIEIGYGDTPENLTTQAIADGYNIPQLSSRIEGVMRGVRSEMREKCT